MKKLSINSQSIGTFAQDWLERFAPGLVALAVVAISFLVSTLIGRASSLSNMVFVAGAVLGLGGLILLLRIPQLGFFLILLSGMFIGYSGPGGINAAALFVGLLFGLWLVDGIVIRKSFQLVDSRTLLPTLIFLLLALVSFIVGQLPWFRFARQAPLDAQVGGLMIVLLSVIAFLLAAHLIRDSNWLRWITWSFIFLGAVYTVLGRFIFREFLDTLVIAEFYKVGATGSMFWTWLTALTIGQVFYNKRLHPFWRFILGGLLAVIVYVTYFQAGSWKSGWIPPLVAVLSIFAIRYWRKAVYLAPVLPIVAVLFAGQVIETDVYSYSTRMEAWTIVMNIAKASPIFGLGFGNYYWYTPLFLIRGWSVQFNSHSQIVDIIAQMGLLGAAVFFWFFGEIGKVGWDLRKVVPDGFERGYVYGALGGIVGSLAACFLADWMFPFVYNIGFTGFRSSVLAWIFMGGLVSIQQFSNKIAGKDHTKGGQK